MREVVRLTVRGCVVIVGSTGVLLELTVDKRNFSGEGDRDSSYVLLRASAMTFLLPSMCFMVMSS